MATKGKQMNAITSAWVSNFVKTGSVLRDLIHYLEVEVHDSEKKQSIEKGTHLSGWSVLDEILGETGLPAGSSVEIHGKNSNYIFEFAFKWARQIQDKEKTIGIVDPFREVNLDLIRANGLNPAKCIIINLQDPFELTVTIMKLVKTSAIDLLIIPPGILQQYWLDDRPTSQTNSTNAMKDAFLRSLKSVVWLCEKSETTVFLLSNNKNKDYSVSPFVSQVRIRILEHETSNFRIAKIEKNSFDPSTIGKQISIPKFS